MPKYWVKQNFNLGSFPDVGQNQKTERKKGGEKRRKKRERLKMASYALQTPPRVAQAKPPGPKFYIKAMYVVILHNTCWRK